MDNPDKLIYNILEALPFDRPEVITTDIDLIGFRRNMDTSSAVDALLKGEYVLVEDFYSTGLSILSDLTKRLKQKSKNESFSDQRNFRSLYRDASHKLLLLVNDNKLTVRKSPSIGWLDLLYPDLSDFLISFPEVQGLNSSWQWYKKGIDVKILKHDLRPFFGTYFPTRFDHLLLFDKWLKTYNGAKLSAIDVGVGSGVLSFQMLQNGFDYVFGTDTNKNAIVGTTLESFRIKLNDKLGLSLGDLFADCDFQSELIVFNPPWIPATHELNGIDKAIYYDNELFPRFFTDTVDYLAEDGNVVIIFSNLAGSVGIEKHHPVKHELETGNRFKLVEFLDSDAHMASDKTKRNEWRNEEKVELWVLTHK